MKTVLIIAYAFPPIGGVGSIRIVKFAKYLAKHGWRPVILTVNSSDEFVLDESLRQELPNDLTIYRTRIWEPLNVAQIKKSSNKLSSLSSTKANPARKGWLVQQFRSLLRTVYFALRIPDDKIGWWPFAIRQGHDIIQRENVDLIFATTPPYTALLIGRTLKRATGVPFVVDYRDEWSSIEYRDYPWNPVTHSINRQLEKSVLRNADAIVGLNQPMLENLEKNQLLPTGLKRLTLPNGFDQDDYAPSAASPSNEQFTITYTGSFYGRRRSPEYFLAALAKLLEKEAVPREQIAVRFIGSIYPEHEQFITKHGLEDIVHVSGIVTHLEAVDEQQNADLLLLIVGNGPGSHVILTGKIFEYLGARRPVLALVPRGGAAAQTIESTRTGFIVEPEDIDAIQHRIHSQFLAWQKGIDNFEPDLSAVGRYGRQAQTATLAEFLNRVAE